jgi:hypothetical protein
VRLVATFMSQAAMRQSLVAAGVDAAPPAAIVRIAAQSIRLVNVIGVAVRIAWVPEYSRHLACGELVRLLHRHDGNVLALGLASGDGASQRRAKRNPNTYGSFQWPLLCAWPKPPQLHSVPAPWLCRYRVAGRPDRNSHLFWRRRLRIRDRPSAGATAVISSNAGFLVGREQTEFGSPAWCGASLRQSVYELEVVRLDGGGRAPCVVNQSRCDKFQFRRMKRV